mmetsp:Transcript_11878/g.36020  ORF Transcript_11878/g.36020 Transcript_11878/m.36020 type:complete len:217 (-) Transcript_11878:1411-2061(-)
MGDDALICLSSSSVESTEMCHCRWLGPAAAPPPPSGTATAAFCSSSGKASKYLATRAMDASSSGIGFTEGIATSLSADAVGLRAALVGLMILLPPPLSALRPLLGSGDNCLLLGLRSGGRDSTSPKIGASASFGRSGSRKYARRRIATSSTEDRFFRRDFLALAGDGSFCALRPPGPASLDQPHRPRKSCLSTFSAFCTGLWRRSARRMRAVRAPL